MELTTQTQQLSAQRAELISVLETFSRQQDVKPTSRELYRRAVGRFFDWVQATGRNLTTLTVTDVIAYKEYLLAAGKSTLTVGGYINALRRFYDWAESNRISINITKGVHAPKRKQEFFKQPLSVAKVGELLHHERTTQSCRDYAIINLMARTGLRCVEVCRANVGDITFVGADNTRVLLVQGKGRDAKDNYVVLTDAAYLPIRDYLLTRRANANEPLFTSESNHTANGGRLTTRTVSGIAKRGLIAVGLDNHVFTAHSLRHTAGTNILRAGGTLEQAQQTLRHANPATTQIYARMALNERRLTDGGEMLLDKLYN